MDKAYFEMQWPRERVSLSCFAHDIVNYRYHWHTSEYEVNILMHGSQEFCRGAENFTLQEDDVILIAPGIGHASYGQQANTRALVLHFSSSALRQFTKKGYIYDFPLCRSSEGTRYSDVYLRIRFYAAQIFKAASVNDALSPIIAKASLDLLIAALCVGFEPLPLHDPDEENAEHRETIRALIRYIEAHYREKITLEDLADYSRYNRTYVSTLFKNTIGVNFYEYLMRVRFQKALLDLSLSTRTKKSLTAVALDNGFSDLKSFNKYFRETLGKMPAEYRAQLSPANIILGEQRNYIAADDPLLKAKLDEYSRLR